MKNAFVNKCKKKRETPAPASLSHMCMFWLFAQYICPIVWFTVENPELICRREICASEKTSNRINLHALPLDITERRFGVRLIAFHMRSVGLEFDLILRFAGYTSPKLHSHRKNWLGFLANSQSFIQTVFNRLCIIGSSESNNIGGIHERILTNIADDLFCFILCVCMFLLSICIRLFQFYGRPFVYSRMKKAHRCALCAAKCFAFKA